MAKLGKVLKALNIYMQTWHQNFTNHITIPYGLHGLFFGWVNLIKPLKQGKKTTRPTNTNKEVFDSTLTLSWSMCLSTYISRKARFAWMADWNILETFLIATFLLFWVSKAELLVKIDRRQMLQQFSLSNDSMDSRNMMDKYNKHH